jgi:MscS family membrane protein
MITNVGKVFVVIVAVIVAAQNMSIEVGGLLTTLGVGGIATALAAQDTLANLFGCIVLFADRPFQIGDKIKVETVEGHVERIGLRSTRLRSAEGVLITIPNRTLANATIHNLSRQPGRHD